MNKCYLSNDFKKNLHLLPENIILSPEGLLNGNDIILWVGKLKQEPKTFATNSIFLLRELYLQKVNVEYHLINGKDLVFQSIDDINDLEILNRELEQADRYLAC